MKIDERAEKVSRLRWRKEEKKNVKTNKMPWVELSIWAIVGIIVCDLCKVKITIEKWQMAFDRFDGIFSHIIKKMLEVPDSKT